MLTDVAELTALEIKMFCLQKLISFDKIEVPKGKKQRTFCHLFLLS